MRLRGEITGRLFWFYCGQNTSSQSTESHHVTNMHINIIINGRPSLHQITWIDLILFNSLFHAINQGSTKVSIKIKFNIVFHLIAKLKSSAAAWQTTQNRYRHLPSNRGILKLFVFSEKCRERERERERERRGNGLICSEYVWCWWKYTKSE